MIPAGVSMATRRGAKAVGKKPMEWLLDGKLLSEQRLLSA
jgi:hypothetical protein